MKKKKLLCNLFVLMIFMCSVQTAFAQETSKEADANEKYNILLNEWAYDKEYIDDVNANFPEYYGGAYIDNDDLVIQVTSLNDEIREYFAELIDLNGVIFEEVTYSFEELKVEQQKIEELMTSDELPFKIVGVGISIKSNSITAYIDNSQKKLSVNDIKKELSDFANIEIEFSEGDEPVDQDVQSWSKEILIIIPIVLIGIVVVVMHQKRKRT